MSAAANELTTISEFSLEENVYRAGLSAGSRAIEPNLFDLLR